jgi:hypothetical protein
MAHGWSRKGSRRSGHRRCWLAALPVLVLAAGCTGAGGVGVTAAAPDAATLSAPISSAPAPVTTPTTGAPTTSTTSAPLPATRDASLWPFASNSPFNTPVGSGAQFAADSDVRNRDLTADHAYINASYWSHPVYQATTSDPMRTVTDPLKTLQYRIPATATPSAPTPGDQSLLVIDPTKRWLYESWLTTPVLGSNGQPTGNYTSGNLIRIDLTDSGFGTWGTRAAGASAFGGLIRSWEIQQNSIHHALAFALPRERMQQGPVWPAIIEDSGSAGSYLGSLRMGTFAAIPSTVDVENLGLSPLGLTIARALQQYGAYLLDAAGQFAFYAEPNAEAQLGPARDDIVKIRDLMRVVTNSSSTNVGGPGQRLAPTAPPLS